MLRTIRRLWFDHWIIFDCLPNTWSTSTTYPSIFPDIRYMFRKYPFPHISATCSQSTHFPRYRGRCSQHIRPFPQISAYCCIVPSPVAVAPTATPDKVLALLRQPVVIVGREGPAARSDGLRQKAVLCLYRRRCHLPSVFWPALGVHCKRVYLHKR